MLGQYDETKKLYAITSIIIISKTVVTLMLLASMKEQAK